MVSIIDLQIAMVSPIMSSCEHTLNTLRYADRVKELGAADPAQMPSKGSSNDMLESNRMDDGVMSPEDSDLAQLRSLNEGELSAEWYNFQVSSSTTTLCIHLLSLVNSLLPAEFQVSS